MLRRVDKYTHTDVSGLVVPPFSGPRSQRSDLNCLTLKKKALRSYEVSVIIYLPTRCNNPEDFQTCKCLWRLRFISWFFYCLYVGVSNAYIIFVCRTLSVKPSNPQFSSVFSCFTLSLRSARGTYGLVYSWI